MDHISTCASSILNNEHQTELQTYEQHQIGGCNSRYVYGKLQNLEIAVNQLAGHGKALNL